MNFDVVKTTKEITLEGITVELEKRNTELYSVSFTDSKGNVVKVSKGGYSEIQVLVPATPKKETKYAVTGKVLGVAEYKEVLDTEYEASNRLNEIVKTAGYPSNNAGLEVKPVEVEIPF